MNIRCCNDTYTRDAQLWRYPWGKPVPGATDLALADLMAIDDISCVEEISSVRQLSEAERRWLKGDRSARSEVLMRSGRGHQPNIGDLIVGMMAPELHVLTMLTVGDIASAAGVSKATIDSYRYRGYLPEPQIVLGRTPLWARPIVRRWLNMRPGSGWRTDLYAEQPGVAVTADA